MTIKEEIEALKATNEHLANILDQQNILIENLTSQLNYLVQFQTGDWEIKDKKMFIYDNDKNILETYELLNANGNPINTSVYKRIKL